MAKIYIVTDGEYSAYRIMGVFDDKEAAERFRLFHLFDEVEGHELNPELPEFSGLAFECRRPLASGGVPVVLRVANTRLHNYFPGDLRIDWYADRGWSYLKTMKPNEPGAAPYLEAVILADDEQHAQKIFMEKCRAFKAGSTWAYYHDRSWLEPTSRYALIEGQLTELPTELREQIR